MSAQHFQPSFATPPASPTASSSASLSASPPASSSTPSLAAALASPPPSSGSPSVSPASKSVSPSSTCASSLPIDPSLSQLTGAARKIFEFVRDCSSGTHSRYSLSVWLTKAEHTQLEHKIFEDFSLGDLYTKLCSIWIPPSRGKDKGWLVVSMPPVVHDEFAELVKDALMNRIASFRQDPNHPANAASRKLEGKLERRIQTDGDGYVKPDIAFQYRDSDRPYVTFPLVVEVGYSQTLEELACKAKRLLRDTDIRTVITFCLPYQNPNVEPKKDSSVNQEATYTIRRMKADSSGILQYTKVDGMICDKHRVTQPGHLQLDLNDFLPVGHQLAPSNGTGITVSHDVLAGILASAFQLQEECDVDKPRLPDNMLNRTAMSVTKGELGVSASSNDSSPQDRKSDKDYTPSRTPAPPIPFSTITRSASQDAPSSDE
ncbi:hypothetical protein OPT61_g5225 [Boeremia exigua]|uniref:Uncharacterized protein n=1 Tax=Boeremia exigua TaxID=749465 RepID=A0ACC2IB65_9PLEO|nr:hypothetical protein OPT61_g5225 [Boeremia exigua]